MTAYTITTAWRARRNRVVRLQYEIEARSVSDALNQLRPSLLDTEQAVQIRWHDGRATVKQSL